MFNLSFSKIAVGIRPGTKKFTRLHKIRKSDSSFSLVKFILRPSGVFYTQPKCK